MAGSCLCDEAEDDIEEGADTTDTGADVINVD